MDEWEMENLDMENLMGALGGSAQCIRKGFVNEMAGMTYALWEC